MSKSRWAAMIKSALQRRCRRPRRARLGRRLTPEVLEERTLLTGTFSDHEFTEAETANVLAGLDGFVNFGQALSATGRFAEPLALLSLQGGSSLSLGQVLDVGGELNTRLVNPVRAYFDAGVARTTEDLVEFLRGQPNIVAVTGGQTNLPTDELRFEVTIQELFEVTNFGIDFGSQGDALGLSTRNTVVNNGAYEFQATFAFGLNLDPDLNTEQAFFVRDVSLGVSLSIFDTATVNVSVGFLEVPNTSATFSYEAELNVMLNDVVPGDFGSITLSELNGFPVADVANVMVGVNQADATFQLRPRLGGWTQPIPTRITLDGPAFGAEANIDRVSNNFEAQQFRNVDAETVFQAFQALGGWVSGLTSSPEFDVNLPFLQGKTLGNTFLTTEYLEFLAELRDDNGQLTFDAIQDFPGASYDPATNRLTIPSTFIDGRGRVARLDLDDTEGLRGAEGLTDLEVNEAVPLAVSSTVQGNYIFDLSQPFRPALPPGQTSPTAEELLIEHILDSVSMSQFSVNGVVSSEAEELTGTGRYGIVEFTFSDAAFEAENVFFANIAVPNGRTSITLRELYDRLNRRETLLSSLTLNGNAELTLNNIEIVEKADGGGGLFDLVIGQFGLTQEPSLTARVESLADFAEDGEIILDDSAERIGKLRYFKHLTNESLVELNAEGLRSMAGWGGTQIESLQAVGLSVFDFLPAELQGQTEQFEVIADSVRAGLEAFESANGTARLQDWEVIFRDYVQPIVEDRVGALGFDDVDVDLNVEVPTGEAVVNMEFHVAFDPPDATLDLGLNLGELARLAPGIAQLQGIGEFGGSFDSITADVSLSLDVGSRIELSLTDDPHLCVLTDPDETSLTAEVHVLAPAVPGALHAEGSIGVIGVELDATSFVIAAGLIGPARDLPATLKVFLDDTDECVSLGELGAASLDTSATGVVDFDFRVKVEPSLADVGRLHFQIPDLSVPGVTFPEPGELPDFLNLGNIELPDNLFALPDGLHDLFGGISTAFNANIFGLSLPFLGVELPGLRNFIGDLQLKIDAALGNLGGFALDNIELAIEMGLNLDQADFEIVLPTPNDLTPDDVQFSLTLDDVAYSEEIRIHSDFGLPWLRFDVEAEEIEVVVSYDVHLNFGVSKDDGVYLVTNNEVLTANVLVNLVTDADGKVFDGQLGFISVGVENTTVDANNQPTATVLDLTFSIDLTDPNNDGKLTVGELDDAVRDPSVLIDEANSGISGGAHLSLKATADAMFFLPSIIAKLEFDWDYGEPVTDQAGHITQPGTPLDRITDVSPTVDYEVCVDVGQFMSETLFPILRPVQSIVGGMDTVLDVLRADLPVISELIEPVSLLDIAAKLMPNSPLPGTIDALGQVINAIEPIVNVVDAFQSGDLGELCLGELHFGPADTINFDVPLPGLNIDLSDFLVEFNPVDLLTELGKLTVDPSLQTDFDGLKANLQLIVNTEGAKFEFPFFKQPLKVFEFLLGFGDATIITLDLPKVSGSIPFSLLVPIFAGVLKAGISGSIGLDASLSVGFDTAGLRLFRQTGDPHSLAEGFFISDTANADGSGPDVPEFTIDGELLATLELDAVVAAAGVGGGVFATIDVDLIDPNHDGKVRGSEIVSGDSGLEMDGEVGVRLKAYVELLGLIRKEFPVAEKALGGFNFTIPFPDLFSGDDVGGDEQEGQIAVLEGRTLTLLVGDRANERSVKPFETDEVFEVSSLGGVFVVTAILDGQLVQQRFNTNDVDVIVADFGNGDDRLFFDGIAIPANIRGGDGADGIITGDGNDTLDGGDGDDSLEGGKGRDTLIGGDGIDTLFGAENNDSLDGGLGDDSLEGAVGDDTLLGGDGNDSIDGGNGVDSILGGEGHDTIDGSNDQVLGDIDPGDIIDAGPGNDVVDGGSGDDCINGGDGADTLHGGVGRDTLIGGADNDVLYGSTENDSLLGENGFDVLLGDEGNDTASGGDGDDTIEGGADADTINGDAGNDVLFGESTADVFRPGFGGGDNIDGGGGRDYLEGNTGDDTLRGGVNDDTIFGGSDNDILHGEQDNDALFGEAGLDTLRGEEGNDSLEGGDDADTLFGGDGHDTVHGQAGGDSLSGNAGRDELSGDAGADTIFGESEDDTVVGNSMLVLDADTIDGGAGDDSLVGGRSHDLLLGRGGADDLFGNDGFDTLDGGDGDDDLFGGIEEDTLQGGLGQDILEGGDGADSLRGGPDNDTLLGQEGADTLFGDGGDDEIEGGTQADEIDGGDGADVLAGNGDDDSLYGNSGADTITGGEGADIVSGNGGDDSLEGNDGRDTMFGGDGRDTLGGGEQDDTIQGGSDEDVLYGDDGDDSLSGNGANDVIRGGEGLDTARGGVGDDLVIGNAGNDELFGDDGDDVLYGKLDHDTLTGGEGNDRAFGEDGNDSLIGDNGDDILEGGDGKDTAFGGSGRDALYGDGGEDSLSGGDDDDFLMAGSGIVNSLNGDNGNDHIVGSDDGGEDPNPTDTTIIGFGDVIDGGPGYDTIESLGGADVITVGTGLGGGSGEVQSIGQGLVGYWPFDMDGSDESGANRDLTLAGNVMVTTGLFGNALDLHGNSSQFATRADSTFDLTGTAYTIQTWVNFNQTNTEQVLIEKLANSLPPGWTLTKLLSNRMRFHADVILDSTDPVDVSPGWHHVAVVRNGSTITMYYDAFLVGEITGVTSTIATSSQPLLLGRRNSADVGRPFPLDGRLDDAAIWNRALSDLEIRTIVNVERVPVLGYALGELIDDAGENDADFVTDGTHDDVILGAPPQPGPTATLNLSNGPKVGGHWAELAGSATDGGLTQVGGLEQSAFATDQGVYVAWVDWRNGSTEIYLAYRDSEIGIWRELSDGAHGGGISADVVQSRRPTVTVIKPQGYGVAHQNRHVLVAWTSIDDDGNSHIEFRRNIVNDLTGSATGWIEFTTPAHASKSDHARLIPFNTVSNPSDETALLAWLDSSQPNARVLVDQYVVEPGVHEGFLAESSGGLFAPQAASPASVNVTQFDIASIGQRTVVASSFGEPGDHDVAVAYSELGALYDEDDLLPPPVPANVSAGGRSFGAFVFDPANVFSDGDATDPAIALRIVENRGTPTEPEYVHDIYVAWHHADDRQDQVVGQVSRWPDNAAPRDWHNLIPKYRGEPARTDAESLSDTLGYATKPDIAASASHVFVAWMDDGVQRSGDGQSHLFVLTAQADGREFEERLRHDASGNGISRTGGSVDSLTITTEPNGIESGSPYVVWTDHSADHPDLTNGPGPSQVMVRQDVNVPQFAVRVTQTGRSTQVTEGGATDTYSIVLMSQPQSNVRVNIATNNQISVSTTQLIFTPTNWQTPQVVTVTAIDETRPEGPHSGTITHTVTSNDPDYSSVTVASITAQIRDNDFGVSDFTPLFQGTGGSRKVSALVLQTTGVINPAILTLQNIRLTQPAARGPGKPIAVRTVAFDPITEQLTITPTKVLSLNTIYQLVVNGLPGPNGIGTITSLPLTFRVGTTLTLIDSDGDSATLTFGGRPGFAYFKTLGFLDDTVQRFHTTLIGTGTGITLAGSMKRGKNTDGIVTPQATETLAIAAGTTFRSTINNRKVKIGPLPQPLFDQLLSASNQTLAGVLSSIP